MIQLFLDCDGVLADFDRLFTESFGMNPREFEKKFSSTKFWDEIKNFPGGFFEQLEFMPGAEELIEATKHLNPIILTGCPKGEHWPDEQKLRWRTKKGISLPMICCQSKKKYMHQVPGKHNIIVDDWPKYKSVWEDAGGTFILHTSVSESIAELKSLGVL